MEQQRALDRLYAWVRAHPGAIDGWVAAGAILIGLLGGFISGVSRPAELLVSLGLTAPLALRRRDPVLSAAIIVAAAALQLVLVSTLITADAAALVSLYSLAAYGPVWASRLGLIAGLLGTAFSVSRYVVEPWYAPANSVVVIGFASTLVLAAWLLGHLRRLGVQNEYRLAERARLLEIERDQQAQLAATAERHRIARELHDVVAHSLSVTVAQADGGRYAAATDPAAATQALETIAGTARQALTDMRALLGVLRAGDGSQFAPQPGIGGIPDLVSQVAASGLDVRLTVDGYGSPLGPGPELAAYRIVQESLTNVLKHGGPGTRATVELHWSPAGLGLVVQDDGRGAGAVPSTGGQGVTGMRERAAMHGGTLEAGPDRGGGYAVRAFLPYVRSS